MSKKFKTNAVLMDYYNKVGDVRRTIEVSRAMLKSKNSSADIRGELCETVLVIMLEDFIKKNHLDRAGWFLSKGLILKDLDNPTSDYLTELDITLFTPKKIYMFECKSYKGLKMADKELTLYTKSKNGWSKKFDVYDQHTKHFLALYKYLEPFREKVNTKYKPYKIIAFDFSDGEILDKREDKYKELFPIKNENNLYSIFNTYNNEPVQWDISYVRKVVEKLEENKEVLTREHLEYVTSLHPSRNSNNK